MEDCFLIAFNRHFLGSSHQKSSASWIWLIRFWSCASLVKSAFELVHLLEPVALPPQCGLMQPLKCSDFPWQLLSVGMFITVPNPFTALHLNKVVGMLLPLYFSRNKRLYSSMPSFPVHLHLLSCIIQVASSQRLEHKWWELFLTPDPMDFPYFFSSDPLRSSGIPATRRSAVEMPGTTPVRSPARWRSLRLTLPKKKDFTSKKRDVASIFFVYPLVMTNSLWTRKSQP